MKKIQFKLLFIAHILKQFWYDNETQNTCLFLKGRSGLWYMPVGRKCDENEVYQSHWELLSNFYCL